MTDRKKSEAKSKVKIREVKAGGVFFIIDDEENSQSRVAKKLYEYPSGEIGSFLNTYGYCWFHSACSPHLIATIYFKDASGALDHACFAFYESKTGDEVYLSADELMFLTTIAELVRTNEVLANDNVLLKKALAQKPREGSIVDILSKEENKNGAN